MAYPLSPLNDLSVLVTLKEVAPNGQTINATDGEVTAFVATSKLPTATAADPALVGTVTYTGNGGRWLARVEAAAPEVLEPLFGGGTVPYLIIQRTGSTRVFVELEYETSKAALND
jgi:hypothetical protein